MTPEEAVRVVRQWRDNLAPGRAGLGEALDVLIDHARATAAPGDLDGLADVLRNRASIAPGVAVVSREEIEEIAAHSCPPAPEIAERPVEIVTGEQAEQRIQDALALMGQQNDETLDYDLYQTLVGILAPEPVAPPAVGDTVETAAQLAALPVGAVVRGRNHVATRWYVGDGNADWVLAGVRNIVDPADTLLPARVLDLGGES